MNLTNRWMNDPRYLAQVGHFLGAYSLVFTVHHFTNTRITGYVFIAGITAAALKEFWYDANYELPKQTSFDNWLDFSMYVAGGVVGFAIGLLK